MDVAGALLLGLVLIFVLRIVLLALRGWWQSRGNPPKPKQPYKEWKD
jgi:sugar phosphate permease